MGWITEEIELNENQLNIKGYFEEGCSGDSITPPMDSSFEVREVIDENGSDIFQILETHATSVISEIEDLVLKAVL